MRTKKPISTVSYNTEKFFRTKCEELLKNHVISDYMYIKHHAESDEKKDHIHAWMMPNRIIDTMDLQDFFKEIDITKPDGKPLKCIDFRNSVTDEWILYNQHFLPYLATKGESREYTYEKSDFKYADEDTFDDLYYHAFKGSEWAKRYNILQQLNDRRINYADLVLNGTVPLSQASQLNALNYMMTHRNYRS